MAKIIFRHGVVRPESLATIRINHDRLATVLDSGEYVIPRGVFASTPPKRKCSYCGTELESKQCRSCGAPNG